MINTKDAMNKSWSQAMVTNNVKSVTILVLSIIILLQQFLLNRDAIEIKIHPANITDTVTVKGNEANPVYKQSWALAMAELIGNINAKNVTFMKDAVMPILSPRLQLQLGKQLDETVTIIKAKNISQIFIVQNMFHNEKNDVIYIWGTKKSFMGGESVSSVKWTYEFKIGVYNGSPRILHVDQYIGTPAKKIRSSDPVNNEFLSNELKDAMKIPMTEEERYKSINKTKEELEKEQDERSLKQVKGE